MPVVLLASMPRDGFFAPITCLLVSLHAPGSLTGSEKAAYQSRIGALGLGGKTRVKPLTAFSCKCSSAAAFIVSTSIVLFYFNLLYCIQAELEDPFGDDYSDLKLRKLFLAPLTKDFQDISLALKASEGQDGDEASNIFVKLVKDMSVMQFDDRASFRAPRVVARSADGDGEEGYFTPK